jgi:hypothetical protein
MKTLKIFLSLSAVLLLVISFGCSKQEDPVEPPTTSLTTTQQTTYASMAEANSEMAIDFAKGFSGGLAGWSPSTSKLAPRDTKLDSGWALYGGTHSNHFNATATTGWYYFNYIYDINPDSGITDTIVYWVKFINDIWADTNAVVTRVDWEMNSTQQSVVTEYSAYATQQPGDSVHSGGWYVGVNASGVVVSWVFTWTNVTETGWSSIPRTCSGSFSYSGYFGVSGNFTFAAGAGTGVAKYNGEQFAKFTYNNDGTGYYTLVGDSYVQQYPFTW